MAGSGTLRYRYALYDVWRRHPCHVPAGRCGGRLRRRRYRSSWRTGGPRRRSTADYHPRSRYASCRGGGAIGARSAFAAYRDSGVAVPFRLRWRRAGHRYRRNNDGCRRRRVARRTSGRAGRQSGGSLGGFYLAGILSRPGYGRRRHIALVRWDVRHRGLLSTTRGRQCQCRRLLGRRYGLDCTRLRGRGALCRGRNKLPGRCGRRRRRWWWRRRCDGRLLHHHDVRRRQGGLLLHLRHWHPYELVRIQHPAPRLRADHLLIRDAFGFLCDTARRLRRDVGQTPDGRIVQNRLSRVPNLFFKHALVTAQQAGIVEFLPYR